MSTARYLVIFMPIALIVIVVASGFIVPLFTFHPLSVNAVNPTVTLSAEIQYVVFSSGCGYNVTIQKETLSPTELIEIKNETYNASAVVSNIQGLCNLVTTEVNNYQTLYYSGASLSSLIAAEMAISLNSSVLCLMVAGYYGGACAPSYVSDVLGSPPIFSDNIPWNIINSSYVISAEVKLGNQLPLTVDKITANESNGHSLNVRFNETTCSKDCSFPITMTSGDYSGTIYEYNKPIRIVLSMSVESAEVWGFSFWWIRIGTTQKTITATLDVNLSNSTVRLLA